jgi:hypothetical protein
VGDQKGSLEIYCCGYVGGNELLERSSGSPLVGYSQLKERQK